MIRLAANLSFLFQDLALPDRFAAASKAGFKGVEYLFPYDWAPEDLRARLADTNLQQVLFNLSPGDWDTGERGLASLPSRQDAFRASVDQALEYAARLGCRRLHVMAGLRDGNLSHDAQKEQFIASLSHAAALAAPEGITLLIEPINTGDMPGYFLDDFDLAADILTTLAHPNVRLQFDLYHCQRIHGNLSNRLERHLGQTGHMQIANPPLRAEPDTGELDYRFLLNQIDQAGYDGWIGCEYKPTRPMTASLGWATEFLANQTPLG
ncbi:2-oxo-tetronate isomerase [Sneathiella chinensis]|uniref:Hydroxypyruvate isomerase n=1 Tax=Sneathiella chinensis TaxID=349750 RepID=A0ABQ5U1L4_9PROT|nr:2-oxo-tetronate isomerase [Sneathiella chinensis]GLQ06022.1 hydroxypyruvate isomerase [Sneathiella chinensis]